MPIKVSKKQRQFLNSESKGTIYRGGIGSGKTRIMCYRAIIGALNGRRAAIVSHSYPMLRDVVLFTLTETLPLFDLKPNIDYTINKSEMIITIRDTELLLRSGDRPDSLRGLNLDDFYIDEAREFKDDSIFLVLLGRIRNSIDAQWFIVSSPNGKDWVYKLAKSDENIKLIIQKTSENPFLPESYILQLQQRYTSTFASQELDADIVDKFGGVFHRKWFDGKFVQRLVPKKGVRYWDVAVSIKTSADYSVGALCVPDYPHTNDMTILDIQRGKLEYPQLRELIIKTAENDGTDIIIGIEEAGQQRGFIDDLKQMTELSPFVIRALKPRGDKFNRALAWAAKAELGQIYLYEAPWNNDFLEEITAFTPNNTHLHDDQIDAVSGAHSVLYKSGMVTTFRAVY